MVGRGIAFLADPEICKKFKKYKNFFIVYTKLCK